MWKCCIPGIKEKTPQPFSTAVNATIAIDISCSLHAFISRPKNALAACCVPPCPPTDVITSLESHHSKLVDSGIIPFYVFDGFKHPMKSATNQDRLKKRKAASDYLNSFYDRGKGDDVALTDEDHSNAMKAIKTLASPSNELIFIVKEWILRNHVSFMCAPFEAEWQCVCLERLNIVQGAMSTLSIFFGPILIIFSDSTFLLHFS